MRFLICLILVFNSCLGFSQFSVSGGPYWLKESIFSGNPISTEKLFKTRLFNYPGYNLQIDFVHDKFRVYTEIGGLNGNYGMTTNKYYSSGGGSSATNIDKREYYSKINFMYLTIKLGLGVEWKKKLKSGMWLATSYNLFGQYDRQLKFSETDHVMYRTTRSNSNQTHTFVTTEHPPNYNSFKQVSYRENILQLGMECKGRLGYRNYFLEVGISLSCLLSDRESAAGPAISYYYETVYDNASLWGLTTGVKLGYVFKQKIKAIE